MHTFALRLKDMVSIILPTYNRAALIVESINSVLQQTYTDFELMILDDGSEDDTENLVKNIDDARIKYFKMPHKGHTSVLKNFAISQSAGEYIAFNDSDDLWKKDKLQKQMQLFCEQPSIGFSITDVTTFSADKILIDHSYKIQGTIQCTNIFERLATNQFLIYNPTLIIKKSCFEKTGLFDEGMISGDYHFNMRLAYYFDAGIIYETLVLRRSHDSNMSELYPIENYMEYIRTFEYLYRQKWIKKKVLYNAKSNAYFKIGNLERKNGRSKNAGKNYLMSLKYGFLFPKHYAALLRTLKRQKQHKAKSVIT